MEKWLESFARTAFLRSAETAHDLKTPLNVAVLNLELLRMRLKNVSDASEDTKLQEYITAIETELRRMARIFDSFFLLSTPPKGEAPSLVDASTICIEAARDAGLDMQGTGKATILGHEARIRQAFDLLFEGTERLFATGTLRAGISGDSERITITVTGVPQAKDFEPSKIFKFYNTDPLGNPDLSLATARLIVETYGGELNAVEESDKVVIRLSLPLGES